MSHSCYMHSSIDGHLCCFHILVIVNNTAVNKGVLVLFRISVLGSFGYIPRSGIAESKGRSIFNLLRYLRAAFHSGWTNLHFHLECTRGSPFSTSSPTLVICAFIDDNHSDRCEVTSNCGFNLHFSDDWWN